MTYTSLFSDLQNYLERGTPNDSLVFAQLPELINFGERRCARELKVLGFIVPAVFTLVDDVERWIGPRVSKVLMSHEPRTPPAVKAPPHAVS